MKNIKDKVIIITGASSGMGKVTAEKLAGLGANVVLAARREENLKEIKAGLGENAMYVVTDVTKKEDVDNLVMETMNKFGRIDVLWNNAGIMPVSFFDEGKVDEWERMIDVNVKGVLYGINAVLPHMIEQGEGHIMATSSLAGLKTIHAGGVYCGTKFAVRAILDTLRQEQAGVIKTTVIYPGAFETELGNTITSTKALELMQNFTSDFADPESIADAIIYAINQPKDVCVNDLVIRPLGQVF